MTNEGLILRKLEETLKKLEETLKRLKEAREEQTAMQADYVRLLQKLEEYLVAVREQRAAEDIRWRIGWVIATGILSFTALITAIIALIFS